MWAGLLPVGKPGCISVLVGSETKEFLGCDDYRDCMTVCAECGWEYNLADSDDFAAKATPLVSEYIRVLRAAEVATLRRRPLPQVWSPLEYACHVRDLLTAQRERVLAARRLDCPVVESMGRDERAEHDGYNDQLPDDVARQLGDAMLLLLNDFGKLSPTDWDRTLIYPYAWPDPHPAQRSLRWIATHSLHELHHHLLDIRGML